MKPLPEYIKIKDKIALVYLGPSSNFLNQLVAFVPKIKEKFPDLKIDIYGKDEFVNEFIKPQSTLDPHKYGMIKKINYQNQSVNQFLNNLL